jgi:hypothetical protein
MSLRLPASLLYLPPLTIPLTVSLYVAGQLYPCRPDSPVPADAEWEDPTFTRARTVHTTPSGGRWVSGSGQLTDVRTTLTLHVEGDAQTCARRAELWSARVEASSRLYVGARYLDLLKVGDRQVSVGRGLGTRSLRWVLELQGELWRLAPDDLSPRRYPLEPEPGNYPLGLLDVAAEGPGYYDVNPLPEVSTAFSTASFSSAYNTYTVSTQDTSYTET